MIDLKTFTPEELMKLAQEDLPTPKGSNLPEVQEFIHSDNLMQGDYPIAAALIYDRYSRWSVTFDTTTMSSNAFFREFKNYFKRKVTAKGIFYLMSTSGFNLSAEYLEALKRKRISNGQRKSKIKKRIESIQTEEERSAGRPKSVKST